MLGIIGNFLGSAILPVAISNIWDWAKNKQAHAQQLEVSKLELEIEKTRHANNIELLKLQSTLKLDEAKVLNEHKIQELDYQAFTESLANARPTGIKFVDVVNGLVRPLITTTLYLQTSVFAIIFIPIYTQSLTQSQQAELGDYLLRAVLDATMTVSGWWFGTRHIVSSRK